MAGVVLRVTSSSIAASLLLASLTRRLSPIPAPIIHYAPGKNPPLVDVALIDRAEHEIDMAAYVLTDWAVMQALTRAADRGVAIRIYLDGTPFAEREPAKLSGPRRDAWPRDLDQAREERSDAPQELPNRRPSAAHRRRERFRIRAQAAG